MSSPPLMMRSYPTLVDLLDNAATSWPDQLALADPQTYLTWRELQQIAARVAGALVRCGLKPGDRVGVFAPKTARTMASLHGALRAAGVCVPVDPVSPVARAAAVLEDCSPAVVIGSAAELSTLNLSYAHARISLDDTAVGALPWDEVMSCKPLPPHAPVQASDLAYLLYTSGSTGQPKGVMLSHQNVSSFACWAAAEFELGTSDRIASVAPLHFDLSTFDIYSSARAGATLCIPPVLYLSFPAKLTQWMHEHHISVMYAVPSLLAMILDRGNLKARSLETLRLLLFAGEVCPPRLLAGVLEALPNVDFANLYGPTETNVCTFERIRRQHWDRISPVSIGVPCDGTRIVLVEENETDISGPGKVGELFVTGPTVALGYWRDPEKSSRRFLEREGARWCRTGDFAEWDRDGHLIFHGRRDHMVKIRGYRVELGEIEAVLLSHPSVSEGAVVVVGESLVGFVHLSPDTVSGEEIREYCATRLPRYMIPAVVNILEEIPHGSTGKIDRLALERKAKAWTTSSNP
jgi:amino acid adenylation domain-containing protein